MKKPLDLAKRFLSMADRDIKTFKLLVDVKDSPDEAVGFHAQQAVEKCLKAVLILNRIELRKIHDLLKLCALLKENKLPAPPNEDKLDELEPYAVTLRYGFVENIEPLNRKNIKQIVETVRDWAGKVVG